MSYSGFYINLDDSVGRRAEIEVEFARFGLQHRYRRFPATKGNTLGFLNPCLTESEIGCFTSHYLLLKDSMASGSHVHVLEDDVVFSGFTDNALQWVMETGVIDQFDMIFTDTFVSPFNAEFREYKALYDRSVDRDDRGAITTVRLSTLRHIAGTNSYVVNRNSIPKLLALYAQELNRGASRPLDLKIRDWTDEGKLRTAALFPFTTSVRFDRMLNTTLRSRQQSTETTVAAWLGRHSFFVACDIEDLRAEGERLLDVPSNDPHHQLLTRILSFSLTDKYRPY